MNTSRICGLGLAAVALVSLAAAPPASAQTVANSSFESPVVNGYAYTYIDGWSATGGGTIGGGSNGVGVDSGGTFANNGVIPDGTQVAFLQTNGSAPTTLAQTITGLIAGDQYVVSFYDNSRAYLDNPILDVTFGGQAITASQLITPVGDANPYNFITSSPYKATATSADLIFSVSIPNAGDASALIDDVTIKDIGPAPVPEASTTVSLGLLLALGLGGLAAAKRRQRA